MAGIFLKAAWRKLLMANYAIDKKILAPHLPYGTEFDFWEGICYVSLVGFMFENTRVKGIRIPFHVNFEEVNLRFYVRFQDKGEWKRGVVFIKEMVPKPALTFVANTLYKEHYETVPMAHRWEAKADTLFVEYSWKRQKKWHSMSVNAQTVPLEIASGSEEEFITEHYWGYTKINEKSTSEYGVEHPRWMVYETKDYNIQVDFGETYGPAFQFLNLETPKSVFLAEGSDIQVKQGRKI